MSCVHSLSVGIRVVLNTCGYSCSDPEKENMQLGFHFMIEIIKMPSKLLKRKYQTLKYMEHLI